MKLKIFRPMIVVIFAIFAGHNIYLSQTRTHDIVSDLTINKVEALARNLELPEVSITCSTGGSGTCYATKVETFGDYCNLTCYATGNPDDYCNEIFNLFIEFCMNFL